MPADMATSPAALRDVPGSALQAVVRCASLVADTLGVRAWVAASRRWWHVEICARGLLCVVHHMCLEQGDLCVWPIGSINSHNA